MVQWNDITWGKDPQRMQVQNVSQKENPGSAANTNPTVHSASATQMIADNLDVVVPTVDVGGVNVQTGLRDQITNATISSTVPVISTIAGAHNLLPTTTTKGSYVSGSQF
jgi:hypothetical protein